MATINRYDTKMSIFRYSFFRDMVNFTLMTTYTNLTIKDEFTQEWDLSEMRSPKEEYRYLINQIYPDRGIKDYDIFLESSCRSSLIYLYSQLENYFTSCFRALLIKFPNEINRSIEADVRYFFKRSFNEIFRTFKNFGVTFVLNEEQDKKINKYREIRNLIAHRLGVIDERFLGKYGNLDFKEGDRIKLTLEMVNEFADTIHELIGQFDEILLKKYNNFLYIIKSNK